MRLRVLACLFAGLIVGAGAAGCGVGLANSSAQAGASPRGTVQAFNRDLAQHDFRAACQALAPDTRPLLTDVRTGHSLASCVAGLRAPGAPQLTAHYRLSAEQIRTAALATLGDGLVSLTPTPVPDPVYLLDKVKGVWLITGL
jgi:hypothetical protein